MEIESWMMEIKNYTFYIDKKYTFSIAKGLQTLRYGKDNVFINIKKCKLPFYINFRYFLITNSAKN
jgi:hypothetical protein